MGKGICSVKGCSLHSYQCGWCQMHYMRWYRYRTFEPSVFVRRTCSVDGCNQIVKARDWCQKHYSRWIRTGDPTVVRVSSGGRRPVEERFWEKVEKDGPLPDTDTLAAGKGPCWIWKASTVGGYGRFQLSRGQYVSAHRLSYSMLVGEIPDGLDLDHLCRNRPCVNPDHLEPVTTRENCRRGARWNGTCCSFGHELTPDNLYISPSGQRVCRICERRRGAAKRARNRLKRMPAPATP